jgi:putative SOS response-associated peptidase YedK
VAQPGTPGTSILHGFDVSVIKQYPETHMVATPVSTRVNTPKNNDAALIKPIA